MSESYSIFDYGVPDIEKKESKAPSTKLTKTISPKPTPKPKEEIKVTGEWTIHFATETFNVSDFVEEIPEEGITLEDLRVEIEKVYFQFTATRTQWDPDVDNKRLYLDAMGASKGGIRCH
ncbi:hypothetical protein [Cytobacillus praedii]|uniref:hypothetical protein n=1 Tax=Cytobacillus praedii TaxID=1742358 RepID=UPI002E23858F|nr:hypothetical protein [Cytobacillus praedii]